MARYCRETAHWQVQTGPEEYVFFCESHTKAAMDENLRRLPCVIDNAAAPGPVLEEAILYPRVVNVAPQATKCEAKD